MTPLVRLGTREHALILILHHIVADGWSMGVLVREVTALYRTFVLGEPVPLPELPIQYADFACWQRQRLRDELLREQLDFWTGRLAGAPQAFTRPAAVNRVEIRERDFSDCRAHGSLLLVLVSLDGATQLQSADQLLGVDGGKRSASSRMRPGGPSRRAQTPN